MTQMTHAHCRYKSPAGDPPFLIIFLVEGQMRGK